VTVAPCGPAVDVEGAVVLRRRLARELEVGEPECGQFREADAGLEEESMMQVSRVWSRTASRSRLYRPRSARGWSVLPRAGSGAPPGSWVITPCGGGRRRRAQGGHLARAKSWPGGGGRDRDEAFQVRRSTVRG